MQFDERLIAWHNDFGRHDLPWQQSDDPYHIWISEIMLQQTQVATVIPYFQRFMKRFPTIESLAQSDLDDVQAHWSGLGYYSRARNIHRSAQIIASRHQGQLPSHHASLLSLPGIGDSTACAILSQAFNKPHAILDGNVKRVLARVFAIQTPVDETKTKKELLKIANNLMPSSNCRQYTQAIMDLGALVCAKKPQCNLCPMESICLAKQRDLVHDLPIKKSKTKVQKMTIHFQVLFNSQRKIAMQKRPESGIWATLWCFPEASERPLSNQTVTCEHVLSHRKLTLHFHLIPAQSEKNQTWLTPLEIQKLGIPQPLRKQLPIIWKKLNQSLTRNHL